VVAIDLRGGPAHPTDPAVRESPAQPADAGHGPPAKSMRILIIEDEADLARHIARALTRNGHLV
jgi:hypothetical protein